ncbi:MAG: hypothetical protein CMH56_04405 [Myxococcales bacterium]|nr:hypothetical protein [Myxococcales bacterium]
MTKIMIVNAKMAEEVRVAILKENRLLDLDIETQSRTKQKGNIYKGVVANIEDSLEAAFIEYGEGRQGFLPLSELRPSLYPGGKKPRGRGKDRPKISDILERGQEIVIQITKDEIGNKGAAVTTYLSVPGRYLVLMHSDDTGGGISRKIDDHRARKRARALLSALDVAPGMAVIIRTAGMNRSREDLFRDFKALAKTWDRIDNGAQLGRAPTLLYREPELVVRTIRDYLAPDIEKIVIDNEDEFEDTKAYFDERMPDLAKMLNLYQGEQPVFENFGIEAAIDELYDRNVKLPSGGELVIDQAEALVAVDVNSSKSTKEDDHESTVYKTNLEAADEIARQLRLRDLGGIVVIDFIDMASRKHIRDVERRLKEAMRTDKARVKIGRISENGTLELTRQRLRQAHRLISHVECSHCQGTGLVRDAEGRAISALRKIYNVLAKSRKKLAGLHVTLPLDVANMLNNRKRQELMDIYVDQGVMVYVEGSVALQGEDVQFEKEGRGQAGLKAARTQKTSDNSRKRKARNSKSQSITQTIGPPASIGAAPAFIEGEEGEQAWLNEPDEPEVLEEEKQSQEAKHYDDPLMEALFGSAPDIQISEALTRPDPAKPEPKDGDENGDIPAKGESKGRQRKKRNRRNNDRRRRKRSSDEVKANEDAAQEQSEEAPSEGREQDDTSGENAPVASEGKPDNKPEMDLKPLQNEEAAPPAPQEAPSAS